MRAYNVIVYNVESLTETIVEKPKPNRSGRLSNSSPSEFTSRKLSRPVWTTLWDDWRQKISLCAVTFHNVWEIINYRNFYLNFILKCVLVAFYNVSEVSNLIRNFYCNLINLGNKILVQTIDKTEPLN